MRSKSPIARCRWWTAGAVAVAAVVSVWWSDEAPYPYAQRLLLDFPLPFLTSACIDKVLTPRPGEKMLEIGPGTGLQSIHVAPQLGRDGQLDVLDIQPQMLEHVSGRARRRGITNIVTNMSDARELPFGDETFDAIYLVCALGEIPEPERVLREVVRVLAPDGRVVIGEFFDRHWISLGRLQRLAEASGLHLDLRRGSTMAYLARFRLP